MILTVSDIAGRVGLPATNRGVRDWLERNDIPLTDDGNRFTFALSDLTAEIRRALLERDVEAAGLQVGTYDDDAHAEMMDATPAMRVAAEAKAAIARDFLAIGSRMSWARKITFVRDRHGAEGTSEASLARISRAVKGVDPINFAPALLSDIARVGRPKVDMSDAA